MACQGSMHLSGCPVKSSMAVAATDTMRLCMMHCPLRCRHTGPPPPPPDRLHLCLAVLCFAQLSAILGLGLPSGSISLSSQVLLEPPVDAFPCVIPRARASGTSDASTPLQHSSPSGQFWISPLSASQPRTLGHPFLFQSPHWGEEE